MLYLKFILFAIFIFLFFRILPSLIRNITLSPKAKNLINKLLPIIELLTWVFFIFRAVKDIFEDKFYFTTLVLGLVIVSLLVFSYFVLKDFAAGVILKTEYQLKKGITLSTNKFSGVITRTGYLNIELLNAEHEIIKVPYSKINGEILKMPDPGEDLKRFAFEIKLKNNISMENTKLLLITNLLNSPWTAAGKIPEVVFLNEKNDYITFKIYVFTVNKDFALKIEKFVKQDEKVKRFGLI